MQVYDLLAPIFAFFVRLVDDIARDPVMRCRSSRKRISDGG